MLQVTVKLFVAVAFSAILVTLSLALHFAASVGLAAARENERMED
jgi:hypothetical protein